MARRREAGRARAAHGRGPRGGAENGSARRFGCLAWDRRHRRPGQRFQSDALLLLLLQLLLVFEHLLLAHLLLSRLLLASLLLSRLLLAHLLFAHLLFAHLLFAHLLFAHLLLGASVRASVVRASVAAHLLLAHLLFAHLLLAHLLLAHLLLLLHLRRHPGPRVSPSAHQHFLQRHERHARRRVRGSKRQIRRGSTDRFVPLDQLGALERTLHRPRGVRVQPRRVRHRTHGLGRDTTTGAARSSRWLLLRALLRVLLRVFDAAASVRVIALALERAHEVRAVWRLTTLG